MTGLWIGLAITLSLISGMVSMLYVFEKIYLDLPQLLESHSMVQDSKLVLEGGGKLD